MTTREQLEVLRSELEQLRAQLHKNGKLNELQVSALLVRTTRLMRESRGGPLERTAASIHGLLQSVQANLRSQRPVEFAEKIVPQ